MVARGADADAIERGRGDRSDPQFTSIERTPTGQERAPDRRRRAGDGRPDGDSLTARHAGTHAGKHDLDMGLRCETAAAACTSLYVDSVSAISDDVYRYTDEAQHLASWRVPTQHWAVGGAAVRHPAHPAPRGQQHVRAHDHAAWRTVGRRERVLAPLPRKPWKSSTSGSRRNARLPDNDATKKNAASRSRETPRVDTRSRLVPLQRPLIRDDFLLRLTSASSVIVR